MPLNPCRKAVRAFIVAAGCATGTLWAEPPPAPVESGALKLDQAIQGIKDEVLQFNRDATTLEQDSLYPAHSRTSVFVGVRLGGLMLREFSVSFDGGETQKFTYNDNEALAFLENKGLRRVVRVNLAPGAHRLRAEFSAQFADAKPDAAPITGSYEAIFDKTYSDANLELTLARATRMAKPTLSLKQWRKTR
jgi:hypothetical protein